jgi:hypothetical protein
MVKPAHLFRERWKSELSKCQISENRKLEVDEVGNYILAFLPGSVFPLIVMSSNSAHTAILFCNRNLNLSPSHSQIEKFYLLHLQPCPLWEISWQKMQISVHYWICKSSPLKKKRTFPEEGGVKFEASQDFIFIVRPCHRQQQQQKSGLRRGAGGACL